MFYQSFLTEVHRKVAPQAYLEIGIRSGSSLALARCRSVAIDPAFAITVELDGSYSLFRTTSDEYFNRPDPLSPTGGVPFDLAFIDGLHLFEYALRDFLHAEAHCSARAVIVFDDILPRTPLEAARRRQTTAWTGDVYPILAVLERYRPELSVIAVDTAPTGLLLVTGLDPANTTLADHYDEIVAEYRHPDPQPVPLDLLERLPALPPQRVLDAEFWSILAGGQDQQPSDLQHRVRTSVVTDLGSASVTSGPPTEPAKPA